MVPKMMINILMKIAFCTMTQPVVIIGQCMWLLIIIHTFLAIPMLEQSNRFLKQQNRLQSKMENQRKPIRQRENERNDNLDGGRLFQDNEPSQNRKRKSCHLTPVQCVIRAIDMQRRGNTRF
uniref:Secreted protein n=1 Tax=Romanomermis culicivorax TaxID=13658 RepID=A0A915LAZ6_ROMCU